jgi:PAS domain S-box-containing protein
MTHGLISDHTLLEALFNSVHGLLYIYTEDGRLIRWNNKHEEMTGYTSEELMNFRAEDWYDEADRIIFAREFPKVFSEGYAEAEMSLIFKDGRKVPFLLTGSRAIIDGKPHLVGVGIDISERKKHEQALRNSEAMFERAEEVAQMGSWNLDIVNNKLVWSKGTYRIFGLKVGQPLTYDLFLETIHPDDRSFVEASWKSALEKAPYDIEHRIIADGRVKWIYEKADIDYNNVGEPIRAIGVAKDITNKKKIEAEKNNALKEIKRLKELLEEENLYLKKEMEEGLFNPKTIIGESDAIKYVLFMVQQVASTGSTVLILGETGTGKGRIANLLHQSSQRKDKPFVVVNCAALPGNLIESELFGREKGAFTGAETKQMGRFELANKGTLFLDEIGELPLELQPKLLRVIEEGKFERLGSPHTVEVDVRIIASTNRNLEEEIRNGNFREDLFYRLNIFPISIPPLRRRKEDIPLLARYFMEKNNKRLKKNFTEVSEEMIRSLMDQAWPGNVRELIGVVERAMIVCKGPKLRFVESIQLDQKISENDSDHENSKKEIQIKKNLADVERDHIINILEKTYWRIEGANGAAKILELNPSTLRARIKKLGIKRPDVS